MSDEISELTRKIAELEAKAAPKDASQPPRPGGVQAAKRAFAFIVVLAIIAFAALSNANRNSPGRSTVAAQPADKVITDLRPPASPASTAPGFATTKWYTPEPPARLRVTNWSCHSEPGYQITEGEVSNISPESMKGIQAVASYSPRRATSFRATMP
jgi:hypothetical protein